VFRLLTGIQIRDICSANEAMIRLLETGVKTVVISSMELGSDDTLLALGSTVTGMIHVVTVEHLLCKYVRHERQYYTVLSQR